MFCKIYKWLITTAPNSNTIPGRLLTAHLDNCPQCKAFYSAVSTVNTNLKHNTADLPANDIAALNEKIIDALPIRSTHKRTAQTRPNWILRPAAITAIAACLIIATGVTLHINQTKKKAQFAQAMELFDTIGQFTSRITADKPQAASFAGFIQNPMAAELNNLTTDASNAANFLISCIDYPIAADQQ